MIAQAQPVTGLYIGGGLGYNNLTQQKIEGDVTANTKSTHVGFGPGFVGVGSVVHAYSLIAPAVDRHIRQ